MATAKPSVSRLHIEANGVVVELDGVGLSIKDALDLFAGVVANAPPAQLDPSHGTTAGSVDFGFSYDPVMTDTEERVQ